MKVFVVLALLVGVVNCDNFYGGACKADNSVKCTAAKNLACIDNFDASAKICGCAADTAYKGEHIGNSDTADSASAECATKCDAAKHKCGAEAVCGTTSNHCECKAGFVYNAKSINIAKQIDSNFACAKATKAADCVGTKAAEADFTVNAADGKCACKDTNKKLTYEKVAGKYTCASASGASANYSAAFLSLAVMAAVAKLF